MAKPRVMQPKEKRPELTEADIQVGKFYRGKNPARVGFYQELNDRKVIHISSSRSQVQYDSSAVADGKHFPKVSMLKFLKWASHEVFRHDQE